MVHDYTTAEVGKNKKKKSRQKVGKDLKKKKSAFVGKEKSQTQKNKNSSQVGK